MPAADLESKFPNLQREQYEIMSPCDRLYNCVAWAAHDKNNKWWPNPYGYWPPNIDREETVECFVRAFNTLGYKTCADGRFELGYEKVAIYAWRDGRPTHAARQRFRGDWTSKLGDLEDITHKKLEAIDSYGPLPQTAEYGQAVHFMKRGFLTSVRARFRQWVDRKYGI